MNEITFKKLIEKVSEYNPDGIEVITKAYNFAAKLHSGQKRKSGEPYIIHPLTVAYILAEMHMDTDTICAGLLHDTIEDTYIEKEDIAREFNDTIAMLVDGVTKISELALSNYTKQDLRNASIRKLIMGVSIDGRIIMLKFADRLHNMRTLEFKEKNKQYEISLETMKIYVPFANYFGTYRIKEELEDLSLKYLNPSEYKRYEEMRLNLERESYPILQEMLQKIQAILNSNGINNEIKIRIKNIYGIYKKMSKGAKIKDIHDLQMLKVIVDTVNECYISLGLAHSVYHPNNRIKDYICNPKINMYQSLHSTLIGPDGRKVQGQFRTFEMDKVASFGQLVCGSREEIQEKLKSKYQFFDSLLEIDKMFEDNQEFIDHVQNEIFVDQVHVYTTDGNIIALPKGATVIDFAYRIHSEVGNNMIGVIVNDEIVNSNYVLQNDDQVQVLTSEFSKGPQSKWLEYAVTSSARKRIKEALRKGVKYGS